MIKPASNITKENTWSKKLFNIFLVYSPFFNQLRNFKDLLFKPVSEQCAKYHIAPWLLTVIGLFIGLLSLGALFFNYWYFVILMSISLSFDFIDGSLARHTSKVSNFGKYLDFAVDYLLMLLMVVGLCLYLDSYYWLIGAVFFSVVLYTNIIAYSPRHIPTGRITLFVPCFFGMPEIGLLLLTLYGLILTIFMLSELIE